MLEELLNISLPTTTQLPVIENTAETVVSDEQLVQSVISGDQEAFSEIFDRYKRPVTRTVSRFFRDRNEIEEFVQQSFTKAYFSLKNFRGGENYSFAAWMTRIAVNVCYDEFRRRQRRAEESINSAEGDDFEKNIEFTDTRHVAADTAIAAAQLAEKMLSALEAKDRIAMTLVYSQDYSLNEAAEIIGISTSNLKSRLFRCRNQIRNRFGYLFK